MLVAESVRDDIAEQMHDIVNDALGSSPVLEFWNGTVPETPEDTPAGSLLATLTRTGSAFGALAGRQFEAEAFDSDTDVEAGTPTFARLKVSGGGACILQFDVPDDIEISNLPMGDGETLDLTELIIFLNVHFEL